METTTEATIESLAADFARRFEGAVRSDGTKYRRVKDDEKSEELTDLIHAAHGDMLPDDWKYQFIEEALDAIAEDGEDADMEPSTYYGALGAWLGSHAERFGYCDEARQEWGGDFRDTAHLLALGMYAEQREVLASVLASLEALVEAAEEAA